MRIRYSNFKRFLAVTCVFSFFMPMAEQVAFAVTNDGYQGNTIPGRSSVAIVDAPGGTRVNTFLGNMFFTRTDLRIPGRGLPIEVELTYNSNQNSIDTNFGFGWRLNYDMSSGAKANGDVVASWGDSRMDLLRFNAGTYTPVNQGVFANLQQVPGNVVQLTTKQQIAFSFDMPASGTVTPLKKIQDPNGNALTFTYDALDQLTTITDASGRSISLSYSNGHVVQVTDSNASPPRTLQYTYDADGNQISFTDPLGNVTTYAYDSGHRMTRVNDALGITNITYSGPTLTVSSISRSALTGTVLSTRSFSYDPTIRATTVTDTMNATTTAVHTYKYDARNRLTQITDPLGHIETRTHDTNGNIASITDPNGNTTQFTYDSRGNVLTRSDALGRTMTFTYETVFNKVASELPPGFAHGIIRHSKL